MQIQIIDLHFLHKKGLVLGPFLISLYTKSQGLIIRSQGSFNPIYTVDTFPEKVSDCLVRIYSLRETHHLKTQQNRTDFLTAYAGPLNDL